jgi:hypothetical protein
MIPLALAAALGVAAPSAAQIIDDFETGAFAFGPDSVGVQPLGSGHAVSPTRVVTTFEEAWATLGSGVGDDGIGLNGPEGW